VLSAVREEPAEEEDPGGEVEMQWLARLMLVSLLAMMV
jgi:hypothetical protein